MTEVNQNHDQHLEEYKMRIDPLNQQFATSTHGVIEFGKILIANLMLINAGGLVAVPAYAQLFHSAIGSQKLTLGITALLFCIGLFCAGLAGLVLLISSGRQKGLI